jgi:hypothetical protein
MSTATKPTTDADDERDPKAKREPFYYPLAESKPMIMGPDPVVYAGHLIPPTPVRFVRA